MAPAITTPGTPASLPPAVRAALAPCPDSAAAEAFTRELTHAHYENFSVVSLLLPRRLRQDFCNIYAFCRTADDLGDELGSPAQSLECLAQFRAQTQACFAGSASAALFVALANTLRRHDLPIQPFLDLIDAFEQDQRVTRYETFEQVVDYCRRSADPVGRLVLYLCGYRDPERQRLSDKTCTALQLANFWQDVRRDLLERDRIYLPRESMTRFGVSEESLRQQIAARPGSPKSARPSSTLRLRPEGGSPKSAGAAEENFRQLLRFEVDRTAALFDEGDALLPLLKGSVRKQVALFGKGGRAVLAAIRRQNYDTLAARPSLSRWQKGRLVISTLGAYVARTLGGGER